MARKAPSVAFYAICNGRRTGIVHTWAECEQLVKGFAGARSAPLSNDVKKRFISDCSKSATAELGKLSATQDEPGSRPSLEDRPVVYTDGACSGNGFNGARAGIGVWWGENDSRNLSESLSGRATNSRAEIHAAVVAIRQAKTLGLKKVEIRTDSVFLVKAATTWLTKWVENGWKLSSGKNVVNREDFEKLLEAADGIDVLWTHVAGHSGIHGNEMADRLAVAGIQDCQEPNIAKNTSDAAICKDYGSMDT